MFNDNFPRIRLRQDINIEQIVTIYYFEYAKDFIFNGEMHDFWEFLYVDKGQAEVMADTEGYKLEQGDIIFHKPNEFHSVWANGKIAPNLIVISFVCNSLSMSFFENKILKIDEDCRNILAKIIEERLNAYSVKLNQTIFPENSESAAPFGSQQLIKIYLELLLIMLVRDNTPNQNSERLSIATRQRVEDDLLNRIILFMKDNISKNLNIDDFCSKFALSRTRLKNLFKEKMNSGIIQYFRYLKIEEAKKLIREEKYNFSQIAEILGFSSVNYFSYSFKKMTNMSPSEYALSIKSKTHIL